MADADQVNPLSPALPVRPVGQAGRRPGRPRRADCEEPKTSEEEAPDSAEDGRKGPHVDELA